MVPRRRGLVSLHHSHSRGSDDPLVGDLSHLVGGGQRRSGQALAIGRVLAVWNLGILVCERQPLGIRSRTTRRDRERTDRVVHLLGHTLGSEPMLCSRSHSWRLQLHCVHGRAVHWSIGADRVRVDLDVGSRDSSALV
mgnify:CR=1 FL=1